MIQDEMPESIFKRYFLYLNQTLIYRSTNSVNIYIYIYIILNNIMIIFVIFLYMKIDYVGSRNCDPTYIYLNHLYFKVYPILNPDI